MPTVTETAVGTALAHCTSPRCDGNSQEPVAAISRETAHTYRERGGDGPGVEASWVVVGFADEADIPCPHCGKAREIADQQRRTYAALSGHDPMGLLDAGKFDAGKQNDLRAGLESKGIDPEKVALQQQNDMLMERLAKLEAEKEGPE